MRKTILYLQLYLLILYAHGVHSLQTAKIRRSSTRRPLPEVHTALLTWRRLERFIDHWPKEQKHLALRATFLAFVSLNDVADDQGAPLVYSGMCNAKRYLHKQRHDRLPVTDINLLARDVVPLLLRDSCLTGRCCLTSLEDSGIIPSIMINDLRVGLLSSSDDFFQYINDPCKCSDGWEAARYLEIRGDLLSLDDEAVILESLERIYTRNQNESTHKLQAALQCIFRRYCGFTV